MNLVLIVMIVMGGISAVGGVTNALWGPRARARRRMRTGVKALAEGEVVTLVGKVRAPSDTLTAPLSGRSCVGFESIANLYEGVGIARKVGRRIIKRQFVAFDLETKQGVVHVVATDDATIAISPVPVIPRSIQRERTFLANHEASAKPNDSSCEEVTIVAGDVIAVQGMATIEHVAGSDERGYRDVEQRARIVAHPEHPLTIGPP